MYKKFRKNNKVVILGSSGFISTALILNLEKRKINITGIARKDIDLENDNSYKKIISKINKNDTVVFVAAKAPVKNYSMLIDNLKICNNVCKALDKIAVRHIVYISSDAVYKDSKRKITENSCAEPTSLHGLMHLTREKMLKEKFSDKLCILRPTLIYGDGDPHNGYGPNMFIRKVKKNNNINLFGKGEEKRDHVWIDDVSEIISRTIISETIGTLNIVTGKVISFYEIANKIIRINNKSKINFTKRIGPMPHNGYRAFNNKKIINYFPDFKFKKLKNWIREKEI